MKGIVLGKRFKANVDHIVCLPTGEYLIYFNNGFIVWAYTEEEVYSEIFSMMKGDVG